MKTKQLKTAIIAPSILAANFFNIKKDLDLLKKNKIKWLHFDVMDGHFVNNISFGVPVFESLKPQHKFINDVHIMVEDPLKWGVIFAQKGADYVTFHLEACGANREVREIIKAIKENGSKVGLSIKPDTPASTLFPFLEEIDLILVMSVEPGFGGQGFISSVLDKVVQLREKIDAQKHKVLIEIDGGINNESATLARKAGVDVLVAGSYLFGREDIKDRIDFLRTI